MTGIQYVFNQEGERTAVMIDLKKYGSIWEDFYDILLAKSRENEERYSLATVKQQLFSSRETSEKL